MSGGCATRGAWALLGALVLSLAGCAAPPPASPPAPDPVVATLPQGQADETDVQRRARIRVELAASYYQQRNFNVALEELKQALTADPGYAPAYGLLGLIYMDLGDRVRAEDSFQRGLKASPADSDLNNNYGWYLCQTGREAQSPVKRRES